MLVDDWGKRFHLPEFAYKLYSSCAFTHPGLDAVLGLAADEKLASSDVERIVLRFPKNGAHMIDGNPLKSHCAQYILPVGLVFGRVIIDDILFDRKRNPEVARLSSGHDAGPRSRPRRELSRALYVRRRAALERRPHRVPPCRVRQGDARESPLTADEVRAKYARLTAPVVPRARSEDIRAAHGIDRRLASARWRACCAEPVKSLEPLVPEVRAFWNRVPAKRRAGRRPARQERPAALAGC